MLRLVLLLLPLTAAGCAWTSVSLRQPQTGDVETCTEFYRWEPGDDYRFCRARKDVYVCVVKLRAAGYEITDRHLHRDDDEKCGTSLPQ